jgi:hypothetical protein
MDTMARNQPVQPLADPPILSTLVASRPVRAGRAGALASVTSVALHVGIVALLFWATMNVGEADEHRNDLIVLLPPPREVAKPVPPPAAPVDAPPPVAGATPPKGSVTISAPTIIPPDIPPPAAGGDFDPLDYTGLGPEGRADGDPERTVTAEDPSGCTRRSGSEVRSVRYCPAIRKLIMMPNMVGPNEARENFKAYDPDTNRWEPLRCEWKPRQDGISS